MSYYGETILNDFLQNLTITNNHIDSKNSLDHTKKLRIEYAVNLIEKSISGNKILLQDQHRIYHKIATIYGLFENYGYELVYQEKLFNIFKCIGAGINILNYYYLKNDEDKIEEYLMKLADLKHTNSIISLIKYYKITKNYNGYKKYLDRLKELDPNIHFIFTNELKLKIQKFNFKIKKYPN
jgi:hypothetical protein